MLTLLAIIVVSGCTQNGGPDVVINPTELSLNDLILTNADLTDYQFKDLSQHPDFQEEMKNPWLIQGDNVKKWIGLIHVSKNIDINKVTGLLFVVLTDETQKNDFGYYALKYNQLSQSDIDGVVESLNYLVRQDKDRFKLFVTKDIIIVLWEDNNKEGLRYLTQLMQTKYGLTETSIEYVSKTDDLIKHIETDLTDDFNSLSYPNKCNDKPDCQTGTPMDYSCLKCPNAKFVFSKGCQSKPGFVTSDSSQGLCTQTHMLGSGYDSFYSGECMPGTAFCLVQFEEYEVPTVYAEESIRFLPLWKEKLMEQSGTSSQYFKEHFYIHSSDVRENPNWNNRAYFSVKYYFKIDWLTITDSDQTTIRNENEQNYLDDNTIKNNFEIKFNHPINQIISKNEVKNKLKTCASGMSYDETRNLRLTEDGKITLQAWAEIDSEANKCKRASLDLESGEILSCQDTACRIY